MLFPFFEKFTLPTITIRVSNSLDLDQDRRSVGPDLGPNCLQTKVISRQNKLSFAGRVLILFPFVLKMKLSYFVSYTIHYLVKNMTRQFATSLFSKAMSFPLNHNNIIRNTQTRCSGNN